jgi:hypothetical protein
VRVLQLMKPTMTLARLPSHWEVEERPSFRAQSCPSST